MTARASAQRSKLTKLADHAYDAMHNPTEAVRVDEMTELLVGLGVVGRKVAEHLGLAVSVRKRRKPVTGERVLPFRKPRR